MKKLKMTLVETRKVWDKFFVLSQTNNLHASIMYQRPFDYSKAGMGRRMKK